MQYNKYRLSFTAASLRVPEMSALARAYWAKRIHNVDKREVIKSEIASTRDREFKELKERMNTLTQEQLQILAHGSVTAQKQIALLSVCKLYEFFQEFIIEVLREKALVFDYRITEGEYNSFFRKKRELHPELEQITDVTASKLRQVLFKSLEQAGLIDSVKTKTINIQLLETNVVAAVAAENACWLKIYLLTDSEIANLLKSA